MVRLAAQKPLSIVTHSLLRRHTAINKTIGTIHANYLSAWNRLEEGPNGLAKSSSAVVSFLEHPPRVGLTRSSPLQSAGSPERRVMSGRSASMLLAPPELGTMAWKFQRPSTQSGGTKISVSGRGKGLDSLN